MWNKTFTLPVEYSIPKFCEDVLKKRFPGDSIRQEINDTDSDKLNFACPYCGDSVKDAHKKRGNLYLSTQTYKCYNDGCAVWVPLTKFVAFFAKKYQLDLPGIELKKVEYTPQVSAKKKGFLIEFLINKEVGKQLLSIKELAKRFSLSPCSGADPQSPIGKFIEKRKIDQLPVFEQSCYYDSRQDKVYLFNLDVKSGRVLGFAIRRIDDGYTGPKYNIKNYSELKKNGLAQDLDEEFIREIDTINNYFNILNINFSQEITLTEGQIDSMFVRNCIATTGVSKSNQLLESTLIKDKTRILFDNDSAGKNESLALLKKGYRVFLWTSAIHDLRKEYPKKLKEIKAIKDINDLYRFLSTQDPALDFEKFNVRLDRYFSASAFDLLLI